MMGTNWLMDNFSYPAVMETNTLLHRMDILNSLIGETWCSVHKSCSRGFLKSWILDLLMFFSILNKMSHGTFLALCREVFLLNKTGSFGVSCLQKTLFTEWSHLFCSQLWSQLTEPIWRVSPAPLHGSRPVQQPSQAIL